MRWRVRAVSVSYTHLDVYKRQVQDLPNVHVVLSGMSDMAQLSENIKTFSEPQPLTGAEREALLAPVSYTHLPGPP